MKKVLAVLAVAVSIAACNNSGAEASASPSTPADSATAKAADTVKAAGSDSTSMKKDSAAKDTTKKM